MWNELWEDFAERAHKLCEGRQPKDSVDETIQWQLRGDDQQVGRSIAAEDLQLPEIYSGNPTDARVVFLCANPSIDPDEEYPTISHWRNPSVRNELRRFFEGRFMHPGGAIAVGDNRQLSYGRRPNNGLAARTWREIEKLLRQSFGNDARLGREAVIADVVPWKFKKWAGLSSEQQCQLIDAGRPYLTWAMGCFRPKRIVICGEGAIAACNQAFDMTLSGKPTRCGRGEIPINGHGVAAIACPHPSVFNKYPENRQLLVEFLNSPV